MKIHPFLISCLLIIIALNISAQKAIPKGYFSSPLGIPLSLTGSFAEVRPNHFHSGLDFSVQQKEGLPVYAVADGVVSRIKVSPIGFGKALYIDHPNGFTSVYAHLAAYNDTISSYVVDNQYKKKSFEVDLFPANRKEYLYVKKGQIIGYAGNSGSSGGAHLHFELRNTLTERIINPLLFGFSIKDTFSPYFDFVSVYPADIQSLVNKKNSPLRLKLIKTPKGYKAADFDTITLSGKVSIGVQAFDHNQNQSDRNGFYSLKMYLDDNQIFGMVCDSFAFTETRYVNALIDYASNYGSGNRIVMSGKQPGSHISFIDYDKNQGFILANDNSIHHLSVEVADADGNNSIFKTILKFQKPLTQQTQNQAISDSSVLFRYNKVNKFENSDIRVEIPVGCLYDNLRFRYSVKPGGKGMFSAIHQLHKPQTPLQSKISVSIKADKVPVQLRQKALLARIDRDGKRHDAGGNFENGYITTTTNLFDGYTIVLDTIAPTIVPSPENARSHKELRFTVGDNFSGIDSYRAEVNGQWALIEWDPKNRLMVYRFDRTAVKGTNQFTLYLSDEKGNKKTYQTSFVLQ